MPGVTREQIAAAFFNLLKSAEVFEASSRRWIHWDQVNEDRMPFLTILKTGERRERRSEANPVLVLEYQVFIYDSAGLDPEDVPDQAMNELLDAVDAIVAPSTGLDRIQNKQTLGGLVSHCYPLGNAFVDTGDADGKAVAAIPFEILDRLVADNFHVDQRLERRAARDALDVL